MFYRFFVHSCIKYIIQNIIVILTIEYNDKNGCKNIVHRVEKEVFEELTIWERYNGIRSSFFGHSRRKAMAVSNKVKYMPFPAKGLEKFGSMYV